MMNVAELSNYINQEFYLNQGGLGTLVVIRDAKRSYGNLRFLVEAKQGDGSRIWIDASRVKGVQS